MKDELLTTNQAAELLEMSPATLWKWRKTGKGKIKPVLDLGDGLNARVRWKRSDVESLRPKRLRKKKETVENVEIESEGELRVSK